MSIYQLTRELSELQAMIDGEDEGTKEAIEETISGMSDDIESAAEWLIKLIKNLECAPAAIEIEIERLSARKKSIESQIGNIKERLKMLISSSGSSKVKTALFSASIVKGRRSVSVVDESLIPDNFINVIVKSSADKKEILKSLIEGNPVAGCEILTSETSIRIK